MKIEIIAVGARQGWSATPIKVRDLYDFHETMEDWREDHEGPFTLQRSTQVVSKHALHSKQIHMPLKKGSKFNGVWAVRNAQGEWIGYWRDKVHEGKCVHTGQSAIHPEHRGKGYFQTFMHMQVFLAFYVYKCEHWSFEVGAEQPQLMSKVDRHMEKGGKKHIKGERDSLSTGDHVVMFEQTRAEQLKRYGTAKHPKDIEVGLVMTPKNAGYKNIMRFTK